MPPVRWKYLMAAVICLVKMIRSADAQVQEIISMTADGWRPIVGNRKPTYYDFVTPSNEILSTVPVPTGTASPVTTTYTPNKVWGNTKSSRKKTNFLKLNPYYALPTSGIHGPQIPLNAVAHSRPGQTGQIKKYPAVKPPVSSNSKRKPIRTYSFDDMLTASAGSYATYNRAPSNIKTRDASGLAVADANYSPKQSHPHFEYNRFALPSISNSVFEQYHNPQLQNFAYVKQPQNTLQYQNKDDEYSRNLVPPPLLYHQGETNSQTYPTNSSSPEVLHLAPIQVSAHKTEPAIEVVVTKEKINSYHNFVPKYNIAPNYNVQKPQKIPVEHPVYEVDESDISMENHQVFKPTMSSTKRRPSVNLDLPPFLPTPFRPDVKTVAPTSPTQDEVSTVFAKLSKLQREGSTYNPNAYNTKEVSTHFPILGKPIFETEIIEDYSTTQVVEDEPTTRKPQRRRRPGYRRTTTTTTTTEEPEKAFETVQPEDNETHKIESYRPVRIRKPSRYRTSSTSTTEPIRSSEMMQSEENEASELDNRPLPRRRPSRYRVPIEPSSSDSTAVEVEENQTYETDTERPLRQRRPHRYRTSTVAALEEPYSQRSRLRYKSQLNADNKRNSDQKTAEEIIQSVEIPNADISSVAMEKSGEVDDEPIPEIHLNQYIPDSLKTLRYHTIRPDVPTTTEYVPTITEESEINTTPELREITTTTTTTATLTTSNRVKSRPIKFDNSNRPRFSVKDYRQKYTTSTTTERPQRSSTETIRIRLPTRFKKLSTTEAPENIEPKRRFGMVKERNVQDKNDVIIPEKNIKSVNTRLRPFDRYKTSSSTTLAPPKVSIKPNLYKRRRPGTLSLKSRIQQNKQNKSEEITTTEAPTTTEEIEVKETQDDIVRYEVENESNISTESTESAKPDTFLYSQRVSDLTSSDKNNYDTPGVFKSVPSVSRRIPNFFTMTTDDPILPIEAFFPNIKEKSRS